MGDKIMKRYEVTLQLDSCKVTVEVEVELGSTEKELEFAADCEVQRQLNYSKLSEYREIS